MSRRRFLCRVIDRNTNSYVAALELRIEKLERRLDYAKSRKESVGNYESETVSPESTDRRDSLAYIRDAIHRKAAKTRENSDVNTLVSDFGFMYVYFWLVEAFIDFLTA